jgi:hypothetical protein
MATVQEVAIDVAHKLNLWEANYYGIFHLDIDGGIKCPYIDFPLLIFLLEKKTHYGVISMLRGFTCMNV